MSKRSVIFLTAFYIFGLTFAIVPQKKKRTRKVQKTEDNRVYLIHSDMLSYDQYKNPDAQILNGHVQFKHNGAKLFCDSAHFYEASNSFEAFGKV